MHKHGNSAQTGLMTHNGIAGDVFHHPWLVRYA